MKLDPVETWLANVAYSHSKSEGTPKNYRWGLNRFCKFAECTSQQILDDYEVSSDRVFRRKWAGILKAFISHLSATDLTISTIANMVTAVKSFFKYMDLPLGFVPLAKKRVTFHNRDITKQEIVAVINISSVRDKAFFTMAAQTGLAPGIMCKLRVKDISPEFDKGIIPFCIRVREENAKGQFGSYFSFAGEETRKSLQAYFKTRDRLGPEDYLFTNIGTDDMLNSKSISNLFAKSLRKLKANGTVSYEQTTPGKHSELRLYCLRKYFRNKSQAGADYTNFWMGHSTSHNAPEIPRSDDHYFSRTAIEAHRKVYRELAMPHLRLESETPSEMEQTIIELRNEVKDLKGRLSQFEFMATPEKLRDLIDAAKFYKEFLKKQEDDRMKTEVLVVPLEKRLSKWQKLKEKYRDKDLSKEIMLKELRLYFSEEEIMELGLKELLS